MYGKPNGQPQGKPDQPSDVVQIETSSPEGPTSDLD